MLRTGEVAPLSSETMSERHSSSYLNTYEFPNVLSEFVYVRTYSRWMEEKARREFYPESVRRYTSNIFKGKPVPPSITQECEQAILDMDVMPSMRALWAAGTAMERDNTTGYNCLGSETEFITQQGVRKFSDFRDGDSVTVLTHTGSWKPAIVHSYGQQQLFNITFVRGRSTYTVRATQDHQWILEDGGRTNNLKVKDQILRTPKMVEGCWDWDAFTVKDIQKSSVETVWCLEVEDDHSFVLPNGIVTGNCSFLPIDNLKAFAEVLYILMCFHPDTMVKTKVGDKRISEITPEDEVATYILETGKTTYIKPEHIMCNPTITSPKLRLTFDDGHDVTCTEDHLFYTHNRGWVKAVDLTEDDEL